jgi:hypothetical protein
MSVSNPSPSGTSSFNPDVNYIVEDAFERCGHELRTGYDLRTARRSLNLLTIEWANRGINLWTIEEGYIPLVPGQIQYPLPTDTIDLLDMVTRTGTGQNQQDININRISESTYSTIPNKNANGRPIQVWIQRLSGLTYPTTATLSTTIGATDTLITVSDASNLAYGGYIQLDSEIINYQGIIGNQLQNCVRGQANTTAASHTAGAAVSVPQLPNISVWPTPDAATTYTFVYWRLRRINDAGAGYDTQDVPFRFIPAMVAGLASYLSIKLPNVDPLRIQYLKQEYEQAFQLAADEDREKASVRFVPREMFYHG